MTNWETLWTFHTKRFSVSLDCTLDNDVDLSWDDTGEVRENLESGFWTAFLYRVRVLCDGHEVGADYLGGSIYENASDFRKVARGEYFPDMVRCAIGEARKALRNMPTLRH